MVPDTRPDTSRPGARQASGAGPGARRPGPAGTGFVLPDDVAAAAGLYAEPSDPGTKSPEDKGPESSVRFYRPLVHRLPGEPGTTGPVDLLLCFPYDLAPLTGGRAYGDAQVGIDFGDSGAQALAVQPAPGSVQPDGTRVAVFGRGHHRLRWEFRPPSAGLRPDGHWCQVLLRLPPGRSGVYCHLSCHVVVRRTVLGRVVGSKAGTRGNFGLRVNVEDAWAARLPLPGLPYPMAAPDGPAPRVRGPEGGLVEGAAGDAPWLRRLFFALDVERYSRRHNTHMARVQRDLWRTARAACAHASVDWHACGRQVSGDGYLLVLPTGISEPAAVAGLLQGVTLALHAVNTDPERPAGIGPTRMRAGLHQGLTCEGASGFLGTAVVELFRVLDAGPLRAALRESAHADLAVAWSDSLYRDLVPHAYPGLDERAFRQVQVDLPEKGFTAGAWIELRARPLGGERPAPAGTEAPDAGNGAPNPH
ncbi:hypothetical protein ACH4GK_15895 [Streptomyces rimosus]|uniref:hypothetical protein n=1 Tax=Streptomyces rimosus TaxID=1927 RepID=UPI00067BF94C|nr:hypothetical protein [Streptomyces rimosus]